MNIAFCLWLADRLHEGDTKIVRGYSKYYITDYVCVSLGFILIALEVLRIFEGKSFLSAVYVMPPVAMGCVCQFLSP